ncbi:MAG: ABC transporter permease [Gemmatimonadaceae bacterium]|nr:ABC transporter permease [Gemmatimonadaceae bacterium]
MGYELFVSRRYLQSKQRPGFLSVIAFIATGGVVLGVAALIIMLSVTNGFTGEVRARLIGMNAHVSVWRYHGDPIAAADTLAGRLARRPGVAATAPIVESKLVLANAEDDMDGVVVWGVDPGSFAGVSDLPAHLYYGDDGEMHFQPRPEGGPPGIILGRSLANRLRVGLGDVVFLLSLREQSLEDVMIGGLTPKVRSFVVNNLFESGMYHYDDNYAFISLAEAREILGVEGATNIHLRLDDLDAAIGVREELAEQLGYPYRVSDWTQQFPELFHWMELEKWVIFIALSLIIVVAAFNITSILTMSILIKTPEIGILRAMGARARGIGRVFLYQGLFIGLVGTFLGCLIGLGVCLVQDRFRIVSIPSDIYIISSLPVDMQPLDFVLVSAVSITICLLAAVLPARKAASLQPVEAIRYIV